MPLNSIFMALTVSYRTIMRGISSPLLEKALVTFQKKCIMQQFKIAKIFGSSFLDFNPGRGKKYAGRKVQKKKERNRNNPLSLPPFALFSHLSLIWNQPADRGGGCCCCWRAPLCQASLWRGLIFTSMNSRPLPDLVSRTWLLMAVFPCL